MNFEKSGKVAALIAGASVVAHLVAAVQMPLQGFGTALMLVMAFGCLVCVWHLWKAPSARRWAQTLLMYGAMLLAHLLIPMDHMHGHHGHEASGGSTMLSLSLALMVVMAVVAAVNLLLLAIRHSGAPRRTAAPVPEASRP
ncbi:hypothetical protein FE374_14345 [Georgenia yuyongxinii]|uniref:Uncharacterized protein n=1 Tax=Georgenia yuyongxinii TaxID=2589797 RepID=A0A5B8C4E4_9MICO|nr:hypothetical protein [Georgenia yuyongxinii]QDC25629.1 hypothetical protein FE374_14345 [Georgenia yuyongxinii]